MDFGTEFYPGSIRLGHDVVECKKCKKLARTGCKEWPELTRKERRRYLWRGIRMFGVLWLFIAGYSVYLYVTDNDHTNASLNASLFMIEFSAIGYAIPSVLILAGRAINIRSSIRRYLAKNSSEKSLTDKAN